MNKTEKATMRQYAKMCDTSHQTISTAIQKGRISKGFDESENKIIVDIADREWGLAFRAKKINEKMKKEVSQDRLDDLSDIPVSEIVISPEDSSFDADRKMTIIKAQRELLKLKTESGELVNREAVDNELFNFGKEIRTAFQAIPDRIIDQIISLDRNAAHKMLSESINDVLEKLSENGN